MLSTRRFLGRPGALGPCPWWMLVALWAPVGCAAHTPPAVVQAPVAPPPAAPAVPPPAALVPPVTPLPPAEASASRDPRFKPETVINFEEDSAGPLDATGPEIDVIDPGPRPAAFQPLLGDKYLRRGSSPPPADPIPDDDPPAPNAKRSTARPSSP